MDFSFHQVPPYQFEAPEDPAPYQFEDPGPLHPKYAERFPGKGGPMRTRRANSRVSPVAVPTDREIPRSLNPQESGFAAWSLTSGQTFLHRSPYDKDYAYFEGLVQSTDGIGLKELAERPILATRNIRRLGDKVRNPFDLSLMAQKLPKINTGSIHSTAYKVLDAPDISDDYYTNLLDWSRDNIVTLGLNDSVYLWNKKNSNIHKLEELSEKVAVTSVRFLQQGKQVAVGLANGYFYLFDTHTGDKIRTITVDSPPILDIEPLARHLTATGDEQGVVKIFDDREADDSHPVQTLHAHTGQVCKVASSTLRTDIVATGGNDNTALLWDLRNMSTPTSTLSHNAAVKGLAFSPHNADLLATGAGTADRCLRIFQINNSAPLQEVATGSQVNNVLWSQTESTRIVTTGGFWENSVKVWHLQSRHPLQEIANLHGHEARILHAAQQPGGTDIATASSDETLRFWKVFPDTFIPTTGQGTTYLENPQQPGGYGIR